MDIFKRPLVDHLFVFLCFCRKSLVQFWVSTFIPSRSIGKFCSSSILHHHMLWRVQCLLTTSKMSSSLEVVVTCCWTDWLTDCIGDKPDLDHLTRQTQLINLLFNITPSIPTGYVESQHIELKLTVFFPSLMLAVVSQQHPIISNPFFPLAASL